MLWAGVSDTLTNAVMLLVVGVINQITSVMQSNIKGVVCD